MTPRHVETLTKVHHSAQSWWHAFLHYLSHTILPHSSNPVANFLWTTLTLLTVIASVGMVAKLLRREKGLVP